MQPRGAIGVNGAGGFGAAGIHAGRFRTACQARTRATNPHARPTPHTSAHTSSSPTTANMQP